MYVPTTGATSALLAPKGTFVATPGASAPMSAPPGTYVKYAGSTSAASCPAGSLSYGGAASCRATDAAVPDSALAGPYFQTSAGRGGAVDLGSSFSPGSAWSLDVGNASPDAADGNQTLLTLLDASLSGTDAGMFELIGFNAGEYYHPQRDQGTLMCHYRHHAHGEPFYLPGLQDITVHVDFSAIAHAALDNGLDLHGYTTQAHFLLNAGIGEILQRFDPNDIRSYLPHTSAAQKLMNPAEMGELFKVIGLSRALDLSLRGFCSGDRSRML
jgi:hypothetical protein